MTTKIRSLLSGLVLLLSANLLFAQGGAVGTILGTVADNTGAVVAKADVEVSNVATGSSQRTQTNESGTFTVPYLKPGTYKVSVSAPGFQKSVVDQVPLVVAQQARVDVVMKPGAVTEQVEVTANAVALDTDSAAVSQLISNRQVEELPLNGRNFLSLIFLGAGAVQTTGEQGAMRQGEGDAISINGSRPTSNNYMLDGLVNTDVALNTPAVIPSLDALQEFKEQTSNYSAEYGFSANQINIATKGGTNTLHGAGFWFGRNDYLDARNFFEDPSQPKAVLRQNQFGYVASGPVYIPKLYDGRNKTFWMANYEGGRIRRGSIQALIVPDPAQLGGDFSGATLPAFGSEACNNSDPSNLGALQRGNPCMPIDPQTGAPFAGNQIPSTRFSRLAQVAMSAGLFPAPNSTPTATDPVNFRQVVTLPNDTNQQTYRLDQSLGRWGSLFGRFTRATYKSSNLQTGSVPWGSATFDEESSTWAISHTITLGQHNVNNFRFGRLEPKANQGGVGAPQSDIDALGLSGVFTGLPSFTNTYPGIGLANFAAVGSPVNDVTTSYIPMWEFADSVTMVRGNHTFGVGFDYRRWVQNRNLANDYNGQFNFTNSLVISSQTTCPTPQCGTGNAVADFLLGYYDNSSTFQPGPFSIQGEPGNLNQYHFLYFAPYIQDDWKVTPRLTLNLGVRWDYRNVPYEEHNKMGWLDVTNPNGGLCVADQRLIDEGIADPTPQFGQFYSYCGRKNPADGSKKPFAPRLGVAWRPFGEKTVIRGGYGIFFDSSEGREIDDSGDIYPYLVRSSVDPKSQETAPKVTDQLFPAVVLGPVNPATTGNFFAVIISERPRNPYVQQWSLSVQHELFRNTTLELNYIGNRGVHLLTRNNIAQALAPSDPAFCQANPTDTSCLVATRRPYPNFTNVYINSVWEGYSSYNAGNVKLEHRSHSLVLQTVYTWAKSLDDKSAAAGIGDAAIGWQGFMDNHNPRLDYGRSDFDVDHRLVSSFVYELPFGRGKRFGGGLNRAVDVAFGGWQVNGVVTFQRGFPYSVFAADPGGVLNVIFGSGNRADLVGDPNSGPQTIDHWFNTDAFTQPAPFLYGGSSRNLLRGPGLNNWDLSLFKNMKFTERLNLQLRLEAFNAFNHPQFNNPPSNAGNNINDPQYGHITSARDPREVQLGVKMIF